MQLEESGSKNYKWQQSESEHVKNESEEQKIMWLADMRKRVLERVKSDTGKQRIVLLEDKWP